MSPSFFDSTKFWGVSFGLIAIPLLLIIAFLFGRYNAERTRRTLKPLRLATSLILSVCAWLLWSASQPEVDTTAMALALGMTFGSLGDLILAGVHSWRIPALSNASRSVSIS